MLYLLLLVLFLVLISSNVTEKTNLKQCTRFVSNPVTSIEMSLVYYTPEETDLSWNVYYVVDLEIHPFLICQNCIIPGVFYRNQRTVFKGRSKISDIQNSVCSLIFLPSKTLRLGTLDTHVPWFEE